MFLRFFAEGNVILPLSSLLVGPTSGSVEPVREEVRAVSRTRFKEVGHSRAGGGPPSYI